MAHYVNCVYCQQRFDRDKEPFELVSNRRYAHVKCAEKRAEVIGQEEKDYEDLEKYIMKLFGKDYLTAKIRKQIRDYRQDYGYSFSGMLKTLKWWYEIKENTTEKAQEGIGIVPFVYEQAEQYYYSLYLANLANENKGDEFYQHKVIEVEIPPPQSYNSLPLRLWNFEEESDE